MRINRIAALILIALSANVYAQTPSSAYGDGVTAGTSAMGSQAGAVTQTNVDSMGSTYQQGGGGFLGDSIVSSLSLLWATSNAGNVGLAQNGNQQMQTCTNYTPVTTNPTQQQLAMNQFCDAVNQLAKAPNYSQASGVNKFDPMFTNQTNAYNQGIAAAGTTNTTIGSGQTGAGACLQTSTTSPATYNNFSCISQAAQNGVPCQVQYSPTVTSTPYCNISGGATVSGNYMPAQVTSLVWSAGPYYQINFGCANTSTGYATIQHYMPLYAYFYTCNYYPGLCITGGNPNSYYPVATLYFTPGVTSAPISWWSMINYDGSLFILSTAYYDGPSGKIVVSNSVPAKLTTSCYSKRCTTNAHIGWPTTSCSTGYTWNQISISNTYLGYCSNPSDPTSMAVPGTPLPGACSNLTYVYNPTTHKSYPTYKCNSNPGGTVGATACGRWTVGAACTAGYGCDSNHFLSGTTCYPNNTRVLPYSVASNANSGTAGIQNVLTNNVNNSCTQYQQQTSAPTATQAIAVNGQWTCPTGMTLNGSLCF